MFVTTCYSAADYKVQDSSSKVQKNQKLFVNVPSNISTVNSDVTDNPKSRKTTLEIKESLPLLETMKCEKNRWDSFSGKWPLQFINIGELVKSGFFYLQSDDKVQCAFCGVILHNWKIGDNPLKEHIKSSPRCPSLLKSETVFIKEQLSLNCLNEYDPLSTSSNLCKLKNPKMVDVKVRLSTFKNWPHPVISAQKLAYCGLYYTGVSDVVICFYCGGSLANWEPTDEPITEHSKFYPRCNYIRIITANPIYKRQTTQSRINSLPNLEVFHSDVVKKAKEIFPSSLVEKVVVQSLQQRQIFSSLHSLCEKILEYEEEEKKTRLSKGKASCEIKQPGYEHFLTGKQVESSDVLLCKICMDREREVAFQPCGHLISCEKCADLISKCPVCRKTIENRVRTFLS